MERDAMDLVIADAGEAVRAIPSPRRDFADVVARAHELAPDRILESAIDEAERHADVIELGRGTGPEEEALDELVADVRVGVLARIGEHRMRPVPPLRIPSAAPAAPRGRVAAVFWIAGGLAAAALIAVIGLRAERVMRTPEPQPASQAVHEEETSESLHDAVLHPPEPPRPTSEPVVPEIEQPVPSVDSAPGVEPDAAAAPSQPRRDRLRAMAEDAQARWRAGDLTGARAIYARIVQAGGRSREAELAYSDLFSLSHQLGRAAERRRWWSGYVRRFPNGRFADDARAGLCRTAPLAERPACWTAYLDRNGGEYRSEAKRAIQGGHE
jgi:hypothetical protein